MYQTHVSSWSATFLLNLSSAPGCSYRYRTNDIWRTMGLSRLKEQLPCLCLDSCLPLRVIVGLLYVCISVYVRELCMQRNGSVCMCVFLLVWEIKLNSKSVIMVVWKEGREGGPNFTSRWGFLFPFLNSLLKNIMLQIRRFHLLLSWKLLL